MSDVMKGGSDIPIKKIFKKTGRVVSTFAKGVAVVLAISNQPVMGDELVNQVGNANILNDLSEYVINVNDGGFKIVNTEGDVYSYKINKDGKPELKVNLAKVGSDVTFYDEKIIKGMVLKVLKDIKSDRRNNPELVDAVKDVLMTIGLNSAELMGKGLKVIGVPVKNSDENRRLFKETRKEYADKTFSISKDK